MMELRTRDRQLQAFHEISQTVLNSLDLQCIVEGILDKALSVGSFDIGSIRLLDSGGKNLEKLASRGYRQTEKARRLSLDMNPGRSGTIFPRVIKEKATQVVENVSECDGLHTFKQEGVQSALVVPVHAQGQFLGLIQLGSRTARKFQPGEVSLLETIGEQMGIAVQKARLFAEANRRRRYAEALREIGLSLTATRDPQQVLQRVAEEARQLTEAMFTFVVTPDKPFYRVAAVAGDDQGYREVIKLSDDPDSLYGRGPLGRAIRSRKPVTCEDVLTDLLFAPWREIATARGIRSLVAVPLLVQEQPVGVLLVYAPLPRAYDDETMSLLSSLAAQAAVAVENAGLYQESRRQEKIQKLLKELSQDVVFLDAASLFKRLADRVREFFGVDVCDVRLVENWQPIGVSGIEPERIRGSGAMSGRSDWILQSRRPLATADIAQEAGGRMESSTRRLGLRGYLAVPLFSRSGAVIGIMRALTYRPREFTQAEVELFQQLANGAAAALENARLFQETERRAREQETLNEIAAATSQSLHLDELLGTAMDKVLEVTGREQGHIRLKDPVTGDLILAAHQGLSEEYAKELLHYRTPGGKSDQVFQSGKPLVMNNPEGTRFRDSIRREGIRSVAWIPLKARGRVNGILNVSTVQPIPFSSGEVELLRAIGNVIGVAVENARLFGETQRSLDQVRALREIEQAMSSTLDLQKVLDILLEKMSLLFPYPTVSIVRLWNKEKNWLEPVACRNVDAREWKKKQAEPKGGLAYYAFNNRAPVVINDLSKDTRVLENSFCRRHRLTSYVGVPLMAKGECLGTISMYARERQQFAEEDVDILSTIASQAAMAIHNAQLYHGMKKLADYLTAANKVKDDFLSVMSHELRTPLNTVVGYTEMVKDQMLGEINQQQRQALEKALNHAGILLDMINRVLLTTQIDAGMIKVESTAVNLGEFFEKLKPTYSVPLAKDVTLLWNYPPNLPLVKTDSHRLKYILQNLINNSIKFTHKGHVAISAGQIPDFRSVELKVTDTGIGIPKEHLSAIFEKFHQVDGSETRLYGGIGLGLYIARQMTERLGGSLEVKSQPGKGSTFTVKIPCE